MKMAGKFGIFISIIFFVSFFSSSFAEEEKKFSLKIRGMNPSDLKALRAANSETPTHFTCKDKSKTIPFNQLNDDYCDCEDASDEPGTSACPNGTFHCRNTGFIGKSIPSSRVSDGICDCCDGSDEKENSVSCKNTCAAEAKEANKGKQQELDSTLKGLVQKKEYLERYSRELAEKKEKATRVEQELDQLRRERTTAEQLRDKLQKDENDARESLKPKDENQETKPPQQEEKNDQDHQNKDENHDEAHYEQPADENTEHYEADQDGEEEGDAEEEEEARGSNDTPAPSQPVVDNEELIPFIDATKKQNDVVSGLNSDVNNKERELDELKKITSFDFGSNSAFYALYGQCFKAETPEYTYEMCPFDKVNQISKRGGGTTSLGTWTAEDQTDGWKNNQSEMKFTNGVRCWGGPDRSVVVKIVCGSENIVSDPAEPNKCEYSLNLATPAACNEANAEQLKRDLSGKHQDDEDEEDKPKTSWW